MRVAFDRDDISLFLGLVVVVVGIDVVDCRLGRRVGRGSGHSGGDGSSSSDGDDGGNGMRLRLSLQLRMGVWAC